MNPVPERGVMITFAPSPTARAKLPNKVTKEAALERLSPLAIKIMMYIVYCWQREQRRQSHPVGFLAAEAELRFNKRDLATNLLTDSVRVAEGRNYEQLVEALNQLMHVKVTRVITKGPANTRRVEMFSFLSRVEYDEEDGSLSVEIGQHFKQAVDLVISQHYDFTLVPLVDTFALSDKRHLRMLMWAATFHNLDAASARTLSLVEVRRALGLAGVSYDSWRQLSIKLKNYCAALATKTSFDVQLVPLYEGRRVVALQFDVKRRQQILSTR